MAKTSLATIKNWFKTGSKPTEQQFSDTWDSFFHKDENIPNTKVEGLPELLNAKADAEALNNFIANGSLFDESEDIRKSGLKLLLNNRTSNAAGKRGYKILRPGIDFSNLTPDYANCDWDIREDFDFNLNDVVLPANVVLNFNGGIFKNYGTITGQSTIIKAASVKLFDGSGTIDGTWLTPFEPTWFGAVNDKDVDSTTAFLKLAEIANVKKITKGHYWISQNIAFDDNLIFETDVHFYIKDTTTGITIQSTLGTSVMGCDAKIHVDGIGYTGTALTYVARGLNGSVNNETRKVFNGFCIIRENYGSPNVTADLTGKGFQISLLAKGEINTAILWMDFDIYCEGFEDAFKVYGNAPGVANMFLNSCKFNITSWWCRNTLVIEQNTGFDITMCHFDLNFQGFSKIEKVIKEINNFDSNPIVEYSQFSIALWDVEVEVSDANVISNLIDKGYGCVYKSRSGEEISRYMAGKTDLMPYVFMDGNHNRSLHTINVQKEILELYFKNIGDSDSFEASCVKLKDNIEDKGIMHDFDFRLTLRDGYVVYAYQLKMDNFLAPDIFNRDYNTVFDITISVKIYGGEVSNIIVKQMHHQGLANNNFDEIMTMRNCKFNAGVPYCSNWRIIGELSGTKAYLDTIKNHAEIDMDKYKICLETALGKHIYYNNTNWVDLAGTVV